MRNMGVDPFLSRLYGVPHNQPMTECLGRGGEGRGGEGRRGTMPELFGHTPVLILTLSRRKSGLMQSSLYCVSGASSLAATAL